MHSSNVIHVDFVQRRRVSEPVGPLVVGFLIGLVLYSIINAE